MANSCPGCGHSFYTDGPVRNGLCKWCVDDQNNPSYCYVCGSVATCSGHKGYLCGSQSCSNKDDENSEKQYRKKYENED